MVALATVRRVIDARLQTECAPPKGSKARAVLGQASATAGIVWMVSVATSSAVEPVWRVMVRKLVRRREPVPRSSMVNRLESAPHKQPRVAGTMERATAPVAVRSTTQVPSVVPLPARLGRFTILEPATVLEIA